MSAPESNRLPVLATEIAAAHVVCIKRGREFVEEAVAAGRLLIEAKELLPHGDWVPWLAANVTAVSVRSAQRYMKAARASGEKRSASFLSLRHLVGLPAERKRAKAMAEGRRIAARVRAANAHFDVVSRLVAPQIRAAILEGCDGDQELYAAVRRRIMQMACEEAGR